jgi:uncharacterized damage-inducible protein DinB
MSSMDSRERSLRDHLRKILDWEDAHAGVARAIAGIPVRRRGTVPKGDAHSLWQLLEHLRICQHDILDFCRNPLYAEIPMSAYWPKTVAPPSAAAWKKSVAAVARDLEDLRAMADDPGLDLHARIPHGSGQTYLRELLLVADHNAYHTGQIVALRRRLGIWKG